MELLLGSHVREAGRRVGRLAGFELEPASRCIRRIIFSPDGELGPQAMTRPLAAISSVHDDGEVDLHPETDTTPMPVVRDVILLSRATRISRGGRQLGRFCGVAVDAAESDRRVRLRTAALVVAPLRDGCGGSRLLDAGRNPRRQRPRGLNGVRT